MWLFTLCVGILRALQLLELSINYLTNTIPDSIGLLSDLYLLSLEHNSINGSIPLSLYNCTSLKYILLENNLIHSTIAPEIGNLTALKRINIGRCWITGSIPDSIGSLHALVYFNLYDNAMTGVIPTSITGLQNIKKLLLSGNRLNGTIPNNINNMTQLDTIDFADNHLTGTIPENIGLVTQTHTLYLHFNNLNGSIPESVYNLVRMRRFYVSHNNLTGTISNSIVNLTALTELYIGYNHFNGTIPALGNSPLISLSLPSNQMTGTIPLNIAGGGALGTCELYDNKFTGPITEATFNFTTLFALYLQDNYLSGPAPSNLETLQLIELNLANNMLTSTLPVINSSLLVSYQLEFNQFSGSLPDTLASSVISYYEVSSNALIGSIPSSLFINKSKLQFLLLDYNQFTGTLPTELSNLESVELFDVASNVLSGSLPSELSKMRALQRFFVNLNAFSGSVTCFNSSSQYFLTNIELSNNQFSGSLPVEPFKIPQLQTFAAVSNCFTGTLPSEVMCGAESLTALALDGLHTASSCRVSLLPKSISSSYGLTYHTPGTIPSCLYNLRQLNTLHVSGNGLEGTLPSDVSLSTVLTDFALSYNQFTGTIPDLFVLNPFNNFDLSFNRLTGTVPPSGSVVSTGGGIYLNVNRLSGEIPAALKYASKISILDGNIFQCNFYRDTLPVNDGQYDYYECGTSTLQWATYSWVALFSVTCVLLLCLLFASRMRKLIVVEKISVWLITINENRRSWMNVYSEPGLNNANLRIFGKFLQSLRISFLLLTLFILVVLLPIYLGISRSYGMYLYKYAWNVSSVYLSGTTPAVLLLVFLNLFLFWMFSVFCYHLVNFVSIQAEDVDRVPSVASGDSIASAMLGVKHYRHYIGLAGVAVLNFVIILAINVGYVILTTRYSPTVVVIVQLVLATFKLIWNDLVIRGLTNAVRNFGSAWTKKGGHRSSNAEERSLDGKYMTFNTYLMILNIIIIPCLATAFVSSDCFYDIIIPPSSIESSYSYQSCAQALLFKLRFLNCTSYEEVTTTTSYLPPFLYRYQCSSTLITTYAELYVYKYIIAAFGQPLLVVAVRSLSKRLGKNSKMFLTLQSVLPQMFFTTEMLRNRVEALFFKDRFNLRVVTYMSVFVTFGVIFPPLAVMICLAVVVHSYLAQLRIGHILNEVSGDPEVHLSLTKLLDNDVMNTGDIFKHSVVYVGPVAAVFYAFIVFDTYGDQVGAVSAIWAAVVMFTVGCGSSFAFHYFVNRPSMLDERERFSSKANAVEMVGMNSDEDRKTPSPLLSRAVNKNIVREIA